MSDILENEINDIINDKSIINDIFRHVSEGSSFIEAVAETASARDIDIDTIADYVKHNVNLYNKILIEAVETKQIKVNTPLLEF